MKKRTILRFLCSGVVVSVIAVWAFNLPSLAARPDKSLYKGKSDIYLFGSIDPDGHKHIWALPVETAAGITRRLAAKYPRQSYDGVIFYRVHSWRDMAKLAGEANQHQGLMIVELFKEVDALKKRLSTKQKKLRFNQHRHQTGSKAEYLR